MLRGCRVITPTSAGGGGPSSCLPQAASNKATASSETRANSIPLLSIVLGITRSIGQHATEQVVELVEFFFLETFEMHVHALDHDGPDLAGHFPALGSEMQIDHAPIELAALAAQQVLLLQAVEHAGHRRNPYLTDASQRGHRVRPLEPHQHQRFPLHAGELQRLHVRIDAAGKRTHDQLDLPADHSMRPVLGRRYGVDVAKTPGGGAHGIPDAKGARAISATAKYLSRQLLQG